MWSIFSFFSVPLSAFLAGPFLSSAHHHVFFSTFFFLCGLLEAHRVCRAVRPVSGEDGILEVETADVLRGIMSTHLFGPDFS